MQDGRIYRNGKWWALRYYKTVIVNGQSKRVRGYAKLHLVDDQHRTEASVRELAAKYLNPVNAGTAPESVDTVGRYLEDVFLPFVKTSEDFQPSTAAGYHHQFNLIKRQNQFCKLPIHKVSTGDVHDVLQAIASEKARGQRSLKNARNFLSGAFKFAVNKRLIATNPVQGVITPKGTRPSKTHAYTLDEIYALLDALHEEPAHTLCLTAALSGLSQSELVALKWDDIADGEINVRRGVWHGKVSKTKTAAREESLPLLPIVKDALDAHKARNGYHEWVFHGETGEPLRMDNFNARVIRPTLKEANIPWHGWHAFRRGLASNLRDLGADPKVAQAILRHANVRTTLDFYTKVRPEQRTAAMSNLEAAFKRGQKQFKEKQSKAS
jgi:integrase